jgi:hypothetical protein
VVFGTASGMKFSESGIKHHMEGSVKDYANPYRIVRGTLKNIERAVKI